MIEKIQLLRNVGVFDSVASGAQLPFSKLTLLHAENGRGKTTLAAILRSLQSGDAGLIAARQRLPAQHLPHVVLNLAGSSPLMLQNGAWSATLPHLAVFDDMFVAENVCSGIEIVAEHRENLHELILGARGVTLNSTVQTYVAKIEEHNRAVRAAADAIPATVRGPLTVDQFCALRANPRIAQAIQDAERNLAAARSAAPVQQQPLFNPISLPAFDTAALTALLARDLPGLETATADRVQAHLATLGEKAEAWVGNGIPRIASASAGRQNQVCPFCAQDLRGSPVISHYQAYFSQAYANLKTAIADIIKQIHTTHGGDTPAAFERAVRIAVQGREFWKTFLDVPEIAIDTAAVARTWKAAREAVIEVLRTKQAAPLDPIALPSSATEAIANYEKFRTAVAAVSNALQTTNAQIRIVKEKAAVANVATLTADLAKLKAVEARYSPVMGPLCQAYLDQKAAKKITEGQRDQAREALDRYRQAVFPAYESAINTYLQKFNAGFRLNSVCSVNHRGGSSCTYNLLINNVPVSLTDPAGGPAFRNTLSAGDRNTLALAFFFASLDQDPLLAQKVVVIDDPMTSLDEHRALTTVQEIRRLIGRVSQVIVLSHSKAFLCALWQGPSMIPRSAITIARDGTGSTLRAWDVNQDCITEHDRRHALVTAYVQGGQPADERAVAVALRPILESFMRVAYPASFPPGTLLGPFIGVCNQRKGTPTEILPENDINELKDLLEYANKFHHDTNQAWETEAINSQELQHFCERTLKFARRI